VTDVPVPSYRVRPSDDGGPPWRLIAIGGGLATAMLVGAALVWGMTRMGSPRTVPLIEPDPRPFKVRPDDPGGLRVPNQDELIFERNRGPANSGAARLAPEPESPRIDALRAQVAQPAPRPAAPGESAPAAAPGATPAARTAPGATPAQPAAPPQTAAQTAPTQPAASRPAPAPGGTIRVQLGALTSEEAARGEWDRLARRHADLLGAFRPQVVRFDREGQATLFRLRTGGFADVAAAGGFCEQARARSIPCTIIR
jgi:cell division septation protein DedD